LEQTWEKRVYTAILQRLDCAKLTGESKGEFSDSTAENLRTAIRGVFVF